MKQKKKQKKTNVSDVLIKLEGIWNFAAKTGSE